MIRQRIPSVAGLRIVVDSDGYMFRHEQDLRRLAGRAMQRVRRERRRVTLPPLNPYDRRIIHMEVSRNEDLDSISEGEGFFKKIIVQRKS
jgi:spoIIIJ-associated protein